MKLLTSWLVPSFSQHNVGLVVLGCCNCLFQLRSFKINLDVCGEQNRSNSQHTYQICCTDMHLVIFLANFTVFHVFFFFKFHRISRIYLNFAGLRPREISEALSYGHPTYHLNVIKLKWEIIWTDEVTPPKWVISRTWGSPPTCKQALSAPVYRTLNTQKSPLSGPPIVCSTAVFSVVMQALRNDTKNGCVAD